MFTKVFVRISGNRTHDTLGGKKGIRKINKQADTDGARQEMNVVGGKDGVQERASKRVRWVQTEASVVM